MKAKIQAPKKMKISKPTKYKKIEVPSTKTSKADLTKANRVLTKNLLAKAKKESKING